MTIGILCMTCGKIWNAKFKKGKVINAKCPNEKTHSSTPKVNENV